MDQNWAERTSLAWTTFFQHELLLAERRKSKLLAGFLAFLAMVVGAWFALTPVEQVLNGPAARLRFLVPGLLVLGCLYELWYLRQLDRTPTRVKTFGTVLVEGSVPTLLLAVGVSLVGPVAGLATPPLLIYCLFIALVALRLEPGLCVLAGAVAGLEYLGLRPQLVQPPFGGTYLALRPTWGGPWCWSWSAWRRPSWLARSAAGSSTPWTCRSATTG